MIHIFAIKWPDGLEIGSSEDHMSRDLRYDEFMKMWNNDPELVASGMTPPISRLDTFVDFDWTSKDIYDYIGRVGAQFIMSRFIGNILHDLLCPCMNDEDEESEKEH